MRILLLRAAALLLILLRVSVESAFADVRLPKLLADHMVWQRDVPTRVWGWADPGEVVTVRFVNQTVRTQTGPDGRWSLRLKPLKAGGPFTMTLRGKNQLTLRDVLVGDLWVCSGQSNMEWPVRDSDNADATIAGATNPTIRLFSVGRQMSTAPQSDFQNAHWSVCSPDSVAGFSAVAYFFGRELQTKLNVPIGLIHSSWGGTNIETWMSASALRPVENFASVLDALTTFDLPTELSASDQAFAQWKAAIPKADAGLPDGKPRWADPALNTTDWQTMSLPQNWEFNELRQTDGAVWFRRTFTLPADATQRGASIQLGPIDESDQVWVNGQHIGETWADFNPNRMYTAPPSALRAGTNVLVVRVEDYGGRGGFYGHPEQMRVESGAFQSPLSGAWQYKIGTPNLPPVPRRFTPNSRPTLLYNAMIHPLLPLAIKGVIWYQGESNVGRPARYKTLFPLMIQDWRDGWKRAAGSPDTFPFLFVQIAPYEPTDSLPAPRSLRAELREAQTAAFNLPNTGMVVTLDIGDAQDIHPRNKQEVGRRLALAARKVAYGENGVHSGPIYDKMTVENGKIRVSFRETGGGLRVDGPTLNEFVIAGADGKFVGAQARLDGNTVLVWRPDVPNPVAVRYAWANNPDKANLFNREGLPAAPFRTDRP
jgi:sialate O-acetylesterase